MKPSSLATKLMLAAILLTVLVYFGVNAASYFLEIGRASCRERV